MGTLYCNPEGQEGKKQGLGQLNTLIPIEGVSGWSIMVTYHQNPRVIWQLYHKERGVTEKVGNERRFGLGESTSVELGKQRYIVKHGIETF
ncbi:MAG: hypothetical protein Q7R79_02035 [bacterium]|nr:hypothetical protein [bacterium]